MKCVDGNPASNIHKEPAGSKRERRLDAFDPTWRRFIRDLTRCSPALEDLAESFPALLFALTSGYGTPRARERAFEQVAAGAPLRAASDALALPWWLRKLPAQAFMAPLPRFPADPEFSVRITSLIPEESPRCPAWLARVAYGFEASGRIYALWIARQHHVVGGPTKEVLSYMAAWAWYSERPGLIGHRLLRRPWTPEMSFRRACEELLAWRERLRLVDYLGPGLASPWLADGTAGDYTFVALRTPDDFIAESEALDNCLDQYAERLHGGRVAVFSIRKDGRSVACVEIGLHEEEVTMPAIVQLRAARNKRASPEVWQATFAWLGAQRLEPMSPRRHGARSDDRTLARRALWMPYLQFLKGTPHLQEFRRLALREQANPRRLVGRRPAPRPTAPA
jgi:hypothetical protein